MENFNVLCAMETARNGNWVVPTLYEHPRLIKPPLQQWITAAAIELGGPLPFAARWPTLLLTALSLIAIYEWGRLFGSWRGGLTAACVAGGTLLLMRFGKRAAYDAPLLFWVAFTNLALTWAWWRQRWWTGCLLAGVALGGALMTKGPPALLHTLAPFILWLILASLPRSPLSTRRPLRLGAAVGGVALATLIAVTICLPWVLAMVQHAHGVRPLINLWYGEVTLEVERQAGASTSRLGGFGFLGMLFPWTLWFLSAFIVAWRCRGVRRDRLLYCLLCACLPVTVHSLLPPMRERYLLPMLPPAAVAIALVYLDVMRRRRHWLRSDLALVALHWLGILGLAVGFPVYASLRGQLPLSTGMILSAAGLLACAGGMCLQRRFAGALVFSTALGAAVFYVASTCSLDQRTDSTRELAQQVAIACDGRDVYGPLLRPPPRALAIYLNQPMRTVNRVDDVPAGRAAAFIMRDDRPLPLPAGSRRLLQFSADHDPWSVWALGGR